MDGLDQATASLKALSFILEPELTTSRGSLTEMESMLSMDLWERLETMTCWKALVLPSVEVVLDKQREGQSVEEFAQDCHYRGIRQEGMYRLPPRDHGKEAKIDVQQYSGGVQEIMLECEGQTAITSAGSSVQTDF